ncbi:MAG: hypothetical protein PUC32_00595 [Oscillospiraceae bacterium]|nr:hypothetical protein [Oscillospiraceae bacterium]
MDDLPLGFAMSLAQHPDSMAYFARLTKPEQQSILEQLHQIQSKEEMRAFVESLPNRP